MFTIGSKLFFGIAALFAVATVFYWYTSDADYLGSLILLSAMICSAFVGFVVVAFRDAEVTAPALVAGSSADPEGRVHGSGPLVSPSAWPVIGGFGAALTALGAVIDRRVFVGGLLLLAATAMEWAVQSWSDRASADPAYNARQRGRIMHPLEFPILGALAVGFVIFLFSRIMLAIPKDGAIVVFIALAALVLIVAFILSSRPKIGGTVLAVLLGIGAVGILTTGVISVAQGERDFAHSGETAEKTSNAVGNKAALFATITVSGDSLNLDSLTIPRTTPVNIMFENKDAELRNLVFEAGETPVLDANGTEVKDANGNAVMQPVRFETDFIGQDKATVLTVRMPQTGEYEFHSESENGTLSGTVTVP